MWIAPIFCCGSISAMSLCQKGPNLDVLFCTHNKRTHTEIPHKNSAKWSINAAQQRSCPKCQTKREAVAKLTPLCRQLPHNAKNSILATSMEARPLGRRHKLRRLSSSCFITHNDPSKLWDRNLRFETCTSHRAGPESPSYSLWGPAHLGCPRIRCSSTQFSPFHILPVAKLQHPVSPWRRRFTFNDNRWSSKRTIWLTVLCTGGILPPIWCCVWHYQTYVIIIKPSIEHDVPSPKHDIIMVIT